MSEELINIYNKLYNDGMEKIKGDQYQTDNLIASTSDKRFGLALVIRLDEHVKEKILKFLGVLQGIEPHQYYYPSSDIHITVLPIIDCYEGFHYDQIAVQDYIDLIARSVSSLPKMEIDLKGITASPSCIMIQGFPQQSVLDDFRNNLRTAFKSSSLHETIDTRYFLRTAHVTVVRFTQPFVAKEQFVQTLDNFKDYDFGKATISEVELVYNDWYVTDKFVKTLFRFKL